MICTKVIKFWLTIKESIFTLIFFQKNRLRWQNVILNKGSSNGTWVVPSELLPSACTYSHLFNKRGGWNKRVGGAKVFKSLNVEAGINVEGGIFWKN